MWLRPLDGIIQDLSADICFQKSISSIPDSSIEVLHLSVVELQNCVLHELENLQFSKRLIDTRVNDPVFAAFLLALKNVHHLFLNSLDLMVFISVVDLDI
ncbi:hypothetical protein GEMRC1_008472 [Eukaryota sp. GEM-RC1]